MGTGPHGGHAGDQWMGDVFIRKDKKTVKVIKNVVIDYNSDETIAPSESKLKSRCADKLHDYIRNIESEKLEEQFEVDYKRKKRMAKQKANDIAKTVKVEIGGLK
jgi:hypothetical protein